VEVANLTAALRLRRARVSNAWCTSSRAKLALIEEPLRAGPIAASSRGIDNNWRDMRRAQTATIEAGVMRPAHPRGDGTVIPTREACAARDATDPLRHKRDSFVIPDGMIYLDGNSLGLLPRNVPARVAHAVEIEWGQTLIKSWNQHGWFDLARRIGDRLARLIGAAPGTVVAADTISGNLFKALAAALKLRPERKVILSDSGNFPSDVYVAQGLRDLLADGHELRLVAPEDVAAAINEDIAVVMLTDVDYRTARLHDMKALTARAHAAGAIAIWDLSHSAGALPVALAAADADFAVGCTYKYLNGGPGSAAFIYVKPALQNQVMPAIAGWWAHEAPFAFDLDFRPAPGITRMQCGTQAIISMAALAAALDVWDDIDMDALREKSKALCGLFITLVEARCARYGLTLAGPRDLDQRGSHVSFHCAEGYAVMQALIAQNIIGDFRAPDIVRFGFTPLYTGFAEVWDAADALARIMGQRLWDTPAFRARKAVT
jgi:kynureninase